MRNCFVGLVTILLVSTVVTPMKGGEYGTVFKRWDLGIDFHALSIREELEYSSSSLNSLGYGVTVGLYLPVLFGDSTPVSIGFNPAVFVNSINSSGTSMAFGLPLLAVIKFNNDALFKQSTGWHLGGTLGFGYTFNALIPLNESSYTLSDWIPTIMAEVNLGKRKSGFPSLFKLRYTKPLGEMVHNNGTLKYTTAHFSLIFTTGF